jgi:lipopolysaccharide export system protein LptA
MKRGLNILISATAALSIALGAAQGTWAQGLGLGGDSRKPIEVTANQGIEWHQKTKRYIARGDAKARQENTTVHGDTLIAYYEETKGKGSEIFRIDAVGNVRIVSPTETAYGDKGVYDVRNGVLVLTGRNLKLVTKEETVTARDSLEYYEKKSMAVARGNAKADMRGAKKGGGRSIRADVLAAYFKPRSAKPAKGRAKSKAKDKKGGKKQSRLDRMDAFGNVVISKPGEIALGDQGFYLPNKEIAELWGKVRITKGKNQLNGERAIVNFKTGISRLVPGKRGVKRKPVQGILFPDKKSNSDKKSKKKTKQSKSKP